MIMMLLKLKVVFEFRLVFGRDAALFGVLDQLRHAPLDDIRRMGRDHGRRSCTCRAMKSMISSYDFVALIVSSVPPTLGC